MPEIEPKPECPVCEAKIARRHCKSPQCKWVRCDSCSINIDLVRGVWKPGQAL